MLYPRPAFRRARWISLDGIWEFGAGDTPNFDRRIRVPFCPQSELSGIHDTNPGDVVWYRRTFDAPACDRLTLHFGAVDYWATVWVNGEELARHEGGHTPFSIDASRFAGRDGNVLVVRARDPLADKTIPRGKQHWTINPEGIFYTATTGIWRSVWLEPLPARSIESLHVFPDLDERAVRVEVGGDGDADVVVTYGGRVVGRRRGSGMVALEAVHAWSPESPHLYDLRVTLDGIDEIDEVDSYFGLRKVEARDGTFWLNNEPYTQRLVLDQGYFPGGLMTALSGENLRRDIELAKQLGFNGARKHQKVEDPRWFYWADRLGFLAWAEMPSFREHSAEAERRLQTEWACAVESERQHPSIVVWAPMNESDGLGADPAAFLDDLYRLTKSLDPTRPAVSNDGWEHATSDLLTLHDYGPPADLARRYRSLETALEASGRERPPFLPRYAYGGQPVIVSEFGGVAMRGAGGWSYSEVRGPEGLLETYREMVDAMMQPGPVVGFCYTQLYDVEQEQNGLLTFDRKPKVDPDLIRSITQTPKRS